MGIQAKNPHADDEDEGEDLHFGPIDQAYDGGVDDALLTEIDHVAIVVEDLDEAIADHRDGFGVLVLHREDRHEEGYEAAFLEVGGSTIQLISPTSDDSEFREFLDGGGPGLHHIGYRVTDCAAAIARLAETDRQVLDTEPVPGPRESKVAFVHPDSAFGVLVQLVER